MEGFGKEVKKGDFGEKNEKWGILGEFGKWKNLRRNFVEILKQGKFGEIMKTRKFRENFEKAFL
jgi:hypothetical protein